jgi:heat-inducible transcriptional repressor
MRLKNVNDQVARTAREQYTRTMRSLEDVLERTSHLIAGLTNYVGVALFTQYDKLYLDGASHIVEQPEFQDIKKLCAILKYLEEKKDLLRLLHSDFAGDRLTVHIGKENISNSLSECSVVTKGYKVKGKVSGRLGVIGPKRMVYERVIPTVEYLADTLTNIFDEMEM